MALIIEQLQPKLVAQFAQIITKQHLAQGYLFAGPAGSGKYELAQWLAMSQFCHHLEQGRPCGQCSECRRIQQGNHPDVIQIKPDNQTIKVESIRYLKSELYKSGMEGNRRVFIVTDAEKMSVNASNSLLKFLEEPASDALIVLTTTAKSQILPTILSRMQIIDFRGLSKQTVYQNFLTQGSAPENAQLAALLTQDYQQAKAWQESAAFNQLLTAVVKWLLKIFKHDDEAFIYVQTLIMAATKTTEDQQLALSMIINFYDFLLQVRYDKKEIMNTSLQQLFEAAQHETVEELADQLNLVLDMSRQLRMNVGFENFLEALTLRLLK
ncbi:DNA polymerase III subunit delta' [Agrilactobacillus fermenti]|uniref:DNA polymerase III subunit delta' n=1 Tax=Agrilactobacillus fermenti TaxID=2586909 RepID=UPI001E37ED68|nr:DNA polymerase III subunit delta' [Agrilactobacillus fermenti]MCD2255447.1 DNA polymerase III subunit delta' [Agrilactobacillus fermenti]